MSDKSQCPTCKDQVAITARGLFRVHGPRAARCQMSGAPVESQDQAAAVLAAEVPAAEVPEQRTEESDPWTDPTPTPRADNTYAVPEAERPAKGPWFGAQYAGDCDTCGSPFDEGDMIRADGDGGWECESWCGQDDPAEAEVTARPAGEPDQFTSPAASPAQEPDQFTTPAPAEPQVNVSGQPPAQYEWRGKVNMGYLVKDPETGDYRRYAKGTPKGLTRATTFNKAASDSKGIYDWAKRNVIIGASRRPDILRKAHGLNHEEHREALDKVARELEDAAGANVASEEGTYLHGFTEYLDAGLKSWADAPERYRAQLKLYSERLAAAGLVPIRGLIERTTMIREFGGVVGTADRFLLHLPSRSIVVGDLKTGKTVEWSMDEIQTQEWIYAHGVNQNGVYDWNTDTWHPLKELLAAAGYGDVLPVVREDVGVIVHMPAQGPLAGQVILDRADLRAGARHAELCHTMRSRTKSKVVPWTGDLVPAPAMPVPEAEPRYGNTTLNGWRTAFGVVASRAEAYPLYEAAKAAGVPAADLQAMAQETLARLSKG